MLYIALACTHKNFTHFINTKIRLEDEMLLEEKELVLVMLCNDPQPSVCGCEEDDVYVWYCNL